VKTFGLALGGIIIAATLVLGGWRMGFSHRVLTEAYSITAIDKALTDASVKAMLIDQIDSDHLADARKHLQLELDADIFTVDVLLDSADDRTRDLAQKVFARITCYREAHAQKQVSASWQADVDVKIASILERAKQRNQK
jgi:hypothetical protein